MPLSPACVHKTLRRPLRLELLEPRLTPALTVVAATPAPLWAPVPMTFVDLHFNNPINPATVQVTDLTLLRNGGSIGSITGAQVVPGTNDQTVRFTLGGLTSAGQLTTYMRPGSVQSTANEPNETYTADYQLTSLGFTRLDPAGGLAYSGSVTGTYGPGAVFNYTFAVEAGQTITLALAPSTATTAIPTVVLRGPASATTAGPELGRATAPAVGASAILQTITAPATGVYTAQVLGSSSFAFKLDAYLNAAREIEGTGAGVTNNTPATAQDLSTAFVPLTATSGAPDRAAVVGQFTTSSDHYAIPAQVGQTVSVGISQGNVNNRLFQSSTLVRQSPLVGASPSDVAIGDVNGDGLMDLVQTLPVNNSVALVHYGFGGGTYFQGVLAPTGGVGVRALRLADLNADGKLDAVVTNEQTNTVGVLFGTGNNPFTGEALPSFELPVLYPTNAAPRALVLGDLDQDGDLDIVVGHGQGNLLSILLHNPDHTFAPAATYAAGGFITNGLAIGDVTGDGVPDIAAVTVDNPNLAILRGLGNGTFAAPVVDATGGSTPQDVALADLNGDGRLDAIALNRSAGTLASAVSIFLNQNNATDPFATPTLVSSGDSGTSGPIYRLGTGDFDGDGRIDLAATSARNGTVNVLLGNGVGGIEKVVEVFTAAPNETFAGRPGALTIGDLNGDGTLDLVTANPESGTNGNTLSVILNGQSRLRTEIVDSNGTVLASGTSAIDAWVAPATATYYLRIAGVGQSAYVAAITRGAIFDASANNTGATARSLDGVGQVLGLVGAPQRLYVALAGTTGVIQERNPATGAVIRTFAAPTPINASDGVGLAHAGNSLFYMRFFGSPGTLYELDPDTGVVRDSDVIPYGSNGLDALAVLNGKVYISDMAGNRIIGFDPGTDTITHVINPLVDLHGGLAGITGSDRLLATVVQTGGTTRVVEIDPATGRITSQFTPGGNGTTPIPNFAARGLAVVHGEIFIARVDALPLTDVYTRSGQYLRTINSYTAMPALGGDDNGLSSQAWYSLSVVEGQTINLATNTPAGGPGEPNNTLLPHLELYSPAGAQVATGVLVGDGRNETITHIASATGTYRVRVSGRSGSSGEYLLSSVVNPAPTAVTQNDTATTAEDVPVGISVLNNDTNYDPATVRIESGPAHGSVTVSSAGVVTYTPAANYSGGDSFVYLVKDANGVVSNSSTVSITVSAVTDEPSLAVTSPVSGNENADIALSISAALVDTDGSESLSLTVSGVPAGGVLSAGTNNQDGTWTLTPAQLAGLTFRLPDNLPSDAAFNLQITATASEQSTGALASVTRALQITVRNVAPVANAGPDVSANEGDSVTLTGTFTDAGSGDTHTRTWRVVNGGNVEVASGTGASITFVPADNGNYTATFTVTDDDNGSSSDTATITVANVAPSPTINTVSTPRQEGTSITATGSASDPAGANDTVTLAWAVFKNGGTTAYATGAGANISFTPNDNGNYRIVLSASDEDGGSVATETTVAVANVVPTATVTGHTTGVRGQRRTFSFSASDVSTVDANGLFRYEVDFGDGSSTVVEASTTGSVLGHVYIASGTYAVRVVAVDKDGGRSNPATHSISIVAVQIDGGTLFVGGTLGSDQITLRPANANGGVGVSFNGGTSTILAGMNQIVVYAQDGADSIALLSTKIGKTTYRIGLSSFLYGEGGADTINAAESTGSNVLLGGADNDVLTGGSGRDILIGGTGVDRLQGGLDDDVLIGGSTAHDDNLAALATLLAEWRRTDLDYTDRVSRLRTPQSGGPGVYFDAASLFDDNAADQLFGEGGQDWFIALASDVVNDKKRNETQT